MGLDMYLNRIPRYKNATPLDVEAVEGYLEYLERPDEYKEDSMEKWCGISEDKIPSQDIIDFYKPYYIHRYSTWDTEKKYGFETIFEQVGYWRKENAIHQWFVDHVQDEKDDCNYHHEVNKDTINKLLDICYEIKRNHSKAKNLMPTQRGFFFGSCNYDEYYFEGIDDTIKILKNVLKTTNFDTQMIYYVSSW